MANIQAIPEGNQLTIDLQTKMKITDDIIENKKTMYDFMNQAYISNIEDGAIERLKYIDKTSPIQFAKDKFTIQFFKTKLCNV